MPQTINLDPNGNPIPNDGVGTGTGGPIRTSIDLAPTCFRGTFQNPCFWILVGAGGVVLAYYLLVKRK